MARYADWYAVELDSYLKGRISDVQRFEAVREVTSHFAEHVEELVERGMDPIEAEKAAIKVFGTPRTAAVNLLQGNCHPKLGGFFTSVATIAMVVLMLMMTFFAFCSFMEYWPFRNFRYLMPVAATTATIYVICLLVGTYLTRTVPAKKLLLGWLAGATVCAGSFVVGQDVHFAGIKPREFDRALSNWKEIREGTLKLAQISSDAAKIVDKYPHTSDEMHTYYPAADNNRSMPTYDQKALDLVKLNQLSLKALAIKHDLVDVVGPETSGYLVPEEGLPYGDRVNGYYPASRFVASDEKEPIARTRFVLAYTKDPKIVVQAWQNSGYVMYGTSEFTSMASRQNDFINRAVEMSKRNRAQIAGLVVGALALYSLPFVVISLVVCWAITSLPSAMVRTTFRRRLA